MIASDALLQTDSYRVEVSGWDEDEIFFVEKSSLSWDEFAGKHISLQHMLADGAIIFVRLSSIQIRIPSLAERLEDIPLLVQFFLKKYNDAYGKNIVGLTRRAQTLLLQHPWRGNVRELENVISTACITATGDFIDISDLPEHLQHRTPRLPGDDQWQLLSLDDVRKVHVQKVLQMCNGNRHRAAQILGIGRTSLYCYLKRDGCDTRPHSNGAAA